MDPSAPALEFERRWYSWGDLALSAKTVGVCVEPGERVAVLLRNHPAHVGLLLGLLQAGACVVTVNPGRGTDRVRSDLAELAGQGVQTVAGRLDDLETFAPATDGMRWLSSDELGVVDVRGHRGE